MKPPTIPIAVALVLWITSCDKGETPVAGGNKKGEKGETPVAGGDTKAGKTAPAVSKHEEVANKVMAAMKELATAVSAISDLDSAQVAATKMGEISDRFSSLAEELAPLDPPTQELKETINRKMEERDAEMEEVMGEKLQATLDSLSPEAQKVMQDAFAEFFGKMEAAGTEFERHFRVEAEEGP